MLVFEISLTRAEALERKISQYLKNARSSQDRSFSSIEMYSTGSKLQHPLKTLIEEYKFTKAREVMMLRDSRDGKISGVGIEVRTGHKWKATEAVEEAETRLKHKDIVGSVATGNEQSQCTSRAAGCDGSERKRRSYHGVTS